MSADMDDLDGHDPLTDDELALSQRGAALIADAIAQPEARASQALRESLDRPRSGVPTRRGLRRVPRPVLVGVGLLVLVLGTTVLTAGRPHSPGSAVSMQEVRDTARLPPQSPPPPALAAAGVRPRLRFAVQGLAFPDWDRAFGWRASGRRQTQVGSRRISTVSYRYRSGTTLVYAIVSGPPLERAKGEDIVLGRTRYRVSSGRARTTVTWTQAGHTCLLDAPRSVATRELLTLAAWDQRQ
jgi:hypothetical protein